jgi:hypothetical protein
MPVSRYHERATSPVALDYSHLSGLKKGTLRIVNASVSPASTDRICLLTTSSSHGKLSRSALSQGDSSMFISDSAHQDEAVVIPENTFYFEDSDASGDGQYLETSDGVLASEATDYTRMQRVQSKSNADSGYSSVSSIHSDNSTGHSGSSPSSSPVSSPTRYEVGDSADKKSYFVNDISRSNDVILKNLALSGSTESSTYEEVNNSGPRQVPYTVSDQTRYYAQLSPLSIPSVPETTGIYDKESNYDSSGCEMDDDEQTQSPFSPILPKHAFAQVTKEQNEETTQPATPSHYLPRNYEAPRGRARSRSIGRGRTKLVKSRKVTV